ncbi:MAG TPA: hypothetical protein PKC45_02630 [Gemmatales bacterium]|nr:hypothetical protein [Gemmatales bacterium]
MRPPRLLRTWETGLPAALLATTAAAHAATPHWLTATLTLVGPALGLTLAIFLLRRRPGQTRPRSLLQTCALLLDRPRVPRWALAAGLLPALAWGGIQAWPFALPLAGLALSLLVLPGLLTLVPSRTGRGLAALVVVVGLTAAAVPLLNIQLESSLWLTALQLAISSLWAGCLLLVKDPMLEGEVELALTSVLLGAALCVELPPAARPAALALPVILFLVIQRWLLRPLQALQLTLAALGRHQHGQPREALLLLRSAADVQPESPWVRETYWQVQRGLEPSQLQADAELRQLVDPRLCLERAEAILLRRPPPTTHQLEEAQRLLALVADRAPQRRPEVHYWQTVADLHSGRADLPAPRLRELLDERSAAPEERASRAVVLVRAWELALWLHPRMAEQVGEPLLSEGRRFDALAAAEEALQRQPGDPIAFQIKQRLYPSVTRAEYDQEVGGQPAVSASRFDHAFCLEIGRSLLADPVRWRRGIELIEIAARGLPAEASGLLEAAWQQAAQHGDRELAHRLADASKTAGQQHGPGQLSETARGSYFAAIRFLAEEALARDDKPTAIAHLRLYAESPQAGVDTVRRLAELCEQEGDIIGTLIANAQCLVYDARQPAFLTLRDRSYFSLTPDALREHWERVRPAFDPNYCVNRARELLDVAGSGPPQADWAARLARLVLVPEPKHVSALVQLGRAELRLGRAPEGLAVLTDAHRLGSEPDAVGLDQEDWYLACRLLGDPHLEAGQAAEAINYFTAYRQSSRSGADTLFKLAKAHEQVGNLKQARTCYEHVAYYNHPLASEAKAALARLKAS